MPHINLTALRIRQRCERLLRRNVWANKPLNRQPLEPRGPRWRIFLLGGVVWIFVIGTRRSLLCHCREHRQTESETQCQSYTRAGLSIAADSYVCWREGHELNGRNHTPFCAACGISGILQAIPVVVLVCLLWRLAPLSNPGSPDRRRLQPGNHRRRCGRLGRRWPKIPTSRKKREIWGTRTHPRILQCVASIFSAIRLGTLLSR